MKETMCPGGTVAITKPSRAADRRQRGGDKAWMAVKSEKGKWFGELGSMARFDVASQTKIRIYVNDCMVELTISPNADTSMEVAGATHPIRKR